MDRVAVFVDAGYLFAQGSVALSGGQRLPRGRMQFDPAQARQALASLATRLSGLPLLRIYWYDGTSSGPTPQHIALAHQDEVKIRLGFVNSAGEQKGVDALVIADMITLARNGAISDAVLLSGDDDLRVGVQQAQEFGVKVHLVGIKPGRGSQSIFLLQEADTTAELGPEDLESFLTLRQLAEGESEEDYGNSSYQRQSSYQNPYGAPVGVISPDVDLPAVFNEVAQSIVEYLDEAELEELLESIQESNQVPKDIDAQLLAKSRNRLETNLDSSQKKQVRQVFRQVCESRLAELRGEDE